MDIYDSWSDLVWYLMIYSFLGWTIEVCIYAVTNHRFVNRGLLDLPFALPYGLTSLILLLVLPTVDGFPMKMLMTCAVYRLVYGLCAHVVRRISGVDPDRGSTRAVRAIKSVLFMVFLSFLGLSYR